MAIKRRNSLHPSAYLLIAITTSFIVFVVVLYLVTRFGSKVELYQDESLPLTGDYDSRSLRVPEDVRLALPPEIVLKEKVRIPIIMYHYVEYVKDPQDSIRRSLTINPHLFEQHLKALEEGGIKTYFVKDVPGILDGSIPYTEGRGVILTFDDGYEDFYTDVYPLLKKYNVKATQYVIYNYMGRRGFLTEMQIKKLVASGLVEIGSHTLDHVYLRTASKTVATEQIFDSKKQFEEKFGIQIESIAYPFGAFSQESINLTKEASYKAAVSVIPGVMQNEANLFYLSRIRAGSLVPERMVEFLDRYDK